MPYQTAKLTLTLNLEGFNGNASLQLAQAPMLMFLVGIYLTFLGWKEAVTDWLASPIRKPQTIKLNNRRRPTPRPRKGLVSVGLFNSIIPVA